jgi:mannose-1-phosphate guanylyltransferase/mannose-6-phosphate isomerase
VKPDKPETGYGYIQTSPGSRANAEPAQVVKCFIEKPDVNTAQTYLNDGGYYWNAGVFVLRASVWLKALGQFRPTILRDTEAAWIERCVDGKFVRPHRDKFLAITPESVDYAALEQCPGSSFHIKMVPLDAGWNDVGAWSAVWQVLPQDAQGNAVRGDVILYDTTNSYVHADRRLVSLIGVQDLVVVETSDAVLVAHKDKAQDVKKVVDQLKAQKRSEVDLHREVFRPWGSYDSVDHGERFQVKRITVNPGAKLSVQMHHHRAEHWVVVSGTALVRIGEEERMVTENQSVYIPVGIVHSLENPGKVPLHLIEVQSGSYLGEDDIVRFEDKYGRVNSESSK